MTRIVRSSSSSVSLVRSGQDSVFTALQSLDSSFPEENLLKTNYDKILREKKIIPESTEVWIPESCPVRANWVSPGWFSPDWSCDPLDEEAVSRIEAFLAIPEEERTWPASLGRELLPRYMKTKLTGVRVPKGKPSSTALSLFRSSARLASFSAKDLKAGVARIAEQSKSQEASGSDKTLDILVSDVQPPQDPPRVMSPEIVQAQKRKREDVILEEEEGEKQPIPAQPIRIGY
ncbi:uncharacterized protein LOC141640139 [Silene latifolia]|uniref:uncharacterized protein LOC141640139 n=1 Tax=Silene latifolia TaxID=37657 RepID=UPI003D785DEB